MKIFKALISFLDARDRGLRQFSIYQGKWNAIERDLLEYYYYNSYDTKLHDTFSL